MKIDKQSPLFLFLMAATGLCVFAIVLKMQPASLTERVKNGQNDFIQLYQGATLNGTPDLYSREANLRVQLEVGVQSDALSIHSRLPFYSFLLKPLAYLPFLTAYFTFQVISLLTFFFFLWMFVPRCRELAAFASLSIPLYATLENGQDTTLVVMFAGLSIYLSRKGKDFWAGFALSFCAIKIHLFFLVPLAILLQRRFTVFYGSLASGAILLAISFLRAGWNWPSTYIKAMGTGDLHPHTDLMPNLHGISTVISGPADLAIEVVLNLAVIAMVAYLAKKLNDYELAFAFAMIGGVLTSFHSYPQDCLILLLPLAILLEKPFSKTARQLMELAGSPIPYFCLFAGAPFHLAMPALLLTILGAAVAHAK